MNCNPTNRSRLNKNIFPTWLFACPSCLNIVIGKDSGTRKSPPGTVYAYVWQRAQSTRLGMNRLLHSLSLVAIGLAVGYETWPPIGWHHAFVIGWSKHRSHYGLTWQMGISTVFRSCWQSLCTSLTAGNCMEVSLCPMIIGDSLLSKQTKLF